MYLDAGDGVLEYWSNGVVEYWVLNFGVFTTLLYYSNAPILHINNFSCSYANEAAASFYNTTLKFHQGNIMKNWEDNDYSLKKRCPFLRNPPSEDCYCTKIDSLSSQLTLHFCEKNYHMCEIYKERRWKMNEVISHITRYSDGDFIIEEGTWAYYGYVLHKGKARVLKKINGSQIEIGILNEGEIFGEMSFIGKSKRSASVVAVGTVEVGVIPMGVFNEAIALLPQSMQDELNAMVSDLTRINEVASRLTLILNDLKCPEQHGIDIETLERKVEEMPVLLQKVTVALAERFNLAMEKSIQMALTIENIIKPTDSLSVSLAKKTA